MFLNESEIKKLVKQSVNEALVEAGMGDKLNVRENGVTMDDVYNGITLYHRPKDGVTNIGGKKMSVVDALFTYGFSREFTSSNGGNMYGAGVYTVYTLKSSNEKAKGYGSAIMKLKLLGGYQDFLIFSEQLAKQTYGNRWHITQQIKDIFPPDVASQILSSTHLVMHDDNDDFSHMRKSSQSAYNIVCMIKEGKINSTKCRGFVYNGGHDGACCFIRDFQSVVPVAVSYDNGRTWQNKLTQELVDRINTEVDTHFQFSGMKDEKGRNMFKQVADKAINGFTVVWNDKDQVNYIPSNSNQTISDIWFDDGENWQKSPDGTLYVNVKYKGYDLMLCYEDGEYMVYDGDGCPQDCTVNDIPELIGE